MTSLPVADESEIDAGSEDVDATLEAIVEGVADGVVEAPIVDVDNRRLSGMRMAP